MHPNHQLSCYLHSSFSRQFFRKQKYVNVFHLHAGKASNIILNLVNYGEKAGVIKNDADDSKYLIVDFFKGLWLGHYPAKYR